MSEKHLPIMGGGYDRLVCDLDGTAWVRAATLGGMKLYAVDTWSDFDDVGVSYIERKLYRTREEAERRAKEVEVLSDGLQYYAAVVEFEVVA